MSPFRSLALFLAAALALSATAPAGAEAPSDHFRSGFYAGLGLGASAYSITGRTFRGDGGFGSNANDESAAVDDGTALGDVTFGYERVAPGGFVWGVEGGLSQPAGDTLSTIRVNSGIYAGDIMATIRYRQGPLVTLRGKLGVVSGRTMIYAALGLTAGREEQTRTQYSGDGVGDTFAAFAETDTRLRKGATLGIGLRQAVNDDWSWSVELRRTELDAEIFRFDGARGGVVPGGGFASVQGRLAGSTSRHDAVIFALVRKF